MPKEKNEYKDRVMWNVAGAKQYKSAFIVLTKGDNFDTNTMAPAYFCAGLTIEHCLKGYLELKNIEYNWNGHDLIDFLTKGSDQLKTFYELSKIDIENIELLNKEYFAKDGQIKYSVRYQTNTGVSIYPNRILLCNLIEKMYQKLNDADLDQYYKATRNQYLK